MVHAGRFADLEDQLCGFTQAGYMGDRSPDRADALIWGVTEIFPAATRSQSRKHAGPLRVNLGYKGMKRYA